MTKLITAALAGAVCLAAYAPPAMACPNGYERVTIQGHNICKIKTPKLPLKAKS